MYIVALLAQKGGVGKSTLVRALAVQAQLARASVGIVDADPQATTSGWHLRRQEKALADAGTVTDAEAEAIRRAVKPPVSAAPDPVLLCQAVDDARDDGFNWLFVDTPAGVSELPATAAELADLVLIPCTPSVDDMDAMGPTVKLAKKSGNPAFFVVNKGRSKGINDECAVGLASAYGLPATHTHISARLPIVDAGSVGRVLAELDPGNHDGSITKGKAEFRALWKWLTKQAGQTYG